MAGGEPATSSSRQAVVPAAVGALGAAGLIPFAACLVAAFAAAEGAGTPWLFALRAYGACILSFLGGIHWGLAIQPPASDPGYARLGPSVVPALVAWLALLVKPAPGFLLLAAAFAGLLAYDLVESRRGHAPAWYPRLRVPLTAAVIGYLLLATFA